MERTHVERRRPHRSEPDNRLSHQLPIIISLVTWLGQSPFNSAQSVDKNTNVVPLRPAHMIDCCCGMEDIAMLLFYLPIIIFEAMLEANANKREADESTVIE